MKEKPSPAINVSRNSQEAGGGGDGMGSLVKLLAQNQAVKTPECRLAAVKWEGPSSAETISLIDCLGLCKQGDEASAWRVIFQLKNSFASPHQKVVVVVASAPCHSLLQLR